MRLVLALLLLAAAAPARAAEATKDQIKMVEYFTKADISDLPPDHIDEFMAIDPQTLPAKLRPKYDSRKLELQTLKQLAENKKKGTIRTPDSHCKIDDEAKSNDPRALKMARYEEISESEERCVEEKTTCTEHDMLCEFSLQITVQRDPKTHKVVGRRLFLYPTDPLFAMVAVCRGKNGAGGNTNFFGQMSTVCSH